MYVDIVISNVFNLNKKIFSFLFIGFEQSGVCCILNYKPCMSVVINI